MSVAAHAGPWISPKLLQLIDARPRSPVLPPELKSDLGKTSDGGLSCEPSDLAETFRHSGWKRRRRLIFESLYRTDQNHTRTSAFATCGSNAFVFRSIEPPYRYRLAGSSCHDKFCTPCARDRSRCIATNVINHMAGEPARFVTLTLKHSTDPLLEQVTRLQRCFARLRGTKAWRTHVVGGAAFVEVKWIENTGEWHPHFHVICQGRYFPKDDLKAAWWRITGDSYITDIRFVEDEKAVARYVVKYASKPANDSFIGRPVQLDEVIAAFCGRRLCHTFGTWRGLKLTESPSSGDWVSIGSLHSVALDAVQGCGESLAAIQQICGESAAHVLAIVDNARPPPTIPKPPDSQLTFAWPPIDSRF
jgi:hypothetical protein